MKRSAGVMGVAIMWLTAMGCENPERETCDGFEPRDGIPVEVMLTTLGYGDFDMGGEDDGGDWSEGVDIIESAEAWAAVEATYGIAGTISPDFSTEVVFVHRWADGGCDPEFEYYAWVWEDALRLRMYQEPQKHGCDAYFPMLGLAVVPREDAVDFGVCE